jgi:colicin import membrane protein
MPEQRENSVLFSLKELRRLEDDRIRQEEAEIRAQAEAERRAREDAERRAREDVERRRREEEDRVRRVEDEQLARSREEQLRLQEAERRARVEAEMRLQEERMRLEIQSKKGRSPLPAVIAVGVVVVAIAGGVIYKLNADAQAEKLVEARRAADEVERIKREADDRAKRLEALIVQKEKDLQTAKTEEERVRLRNEIERAQERRRAVPRREAPRKEEVSPAAAKPAIRPKRVVSDNPLDGLKL